MISNKDRQEFLRRLMTSRQKLTTLEIELTFQKKNEEASEVREKARALQIEIDDLLGQLIDEWLGEGQVLLDSVAIAYTALQASIANIKKKKEAAENFVKAIGFIDDIIGLAKGVKP